MGMFKIEDLLELPREFFVEYFGKYGVEIYDRIRGVDDRELIVNRDRKSYGRENTLKYDIDDKEEILEYIYKFSKEISRQLASENTFIRTITVKYKNSSFVNHTRSKTIGYYTNDLEVIYNIAKEIITEEEFKETIRLIGLSVSGIKEEKSHQLTLF